ncbi:MAG: site-specific DNA-methyltransferase [Armatimonadetes bacterium]|nr:site-specific DNA-methyltransferase [Armatimonadota bacterium]
MKPHSSSAKRNLTEIHIPRRVKAGELWQLGRHRLLCGDSRDKEQVARLMQSEHATLTITSPPYNLGKSALLAENRYLKESRYLNSPDKRTTSEYLALLEAVTRNALEVSETVIVNLQMLSGNKLAFLEYLYQLRHNLADIAIWDKQIFPPLIGRNILSNQFEFLLFFSSRKRGKNATRTIHTADFRGRVSNVYQGKPQRNNAYHRYHAATFPAHLPKWLMETFDNEQGIVLDPFVGTGTTLMVAEETGRRCFGMEIDSLYCDIVLHRFENVTGVKPLLVARKR